MQIVGVWKPKNSNTTNVKVKLPADEAPVDEPTGFKYNQC